MNQTDQKTRAREAVTAAKRLGHDFGVVVETSEHSRHVWLVEVEDVALRERATFTKPHPHDPHARSVGVNVQFTYPRLTALLEVCDDPRGLQHPELWSMLQQIDIRRRFWFMPSKSAIGDASRAEPMLAVFVGLDGREHTSNPEFVQKR